MRVLFAGVCAVVVLVPPGSESRPFFDKSGAVPVVVSLAFSVMCSHGRAHAACSAGRARFYGRHRVELNQLWPRRRRLDDVGPAEKHSTEEAAACTAQSAPARRRALAVRAPVIQLSTSEARCGQARAACAARAAAAPAAAARATSLESAIQPLDLT